MGTQSRTVEGTLARLCHGSHGVVDRQALLAAGITVAEIKHRLKTGALLREFPGVYRVGHRAPSTEARYMSAVKACGAGSMLAGEAAAHLLELVRREPPGPEVIAPRERRIKGIRTRRCRRIDARDRTTSRGIPVTSPARTLVDLAAILSEYELGRACHEAGVRHRTTPADVEEVLSRRPTSPGAAKLRRILHGDSKITVSRLEARFLGLVRAAALPLPAMNERAGGRRVDARWPGRRVTIELDSYRYHHSRHAWEQDRRREREARARGDEFRRYTWGDVVEQPDQMLAELERLLGRDRPG